MGFRNPVRSLSASQITPGTFGVGVRLPAGQLDSGQVDPGVVIIAGTPGAARVEISGIGLRAYAPDGVTVLMDLAAGAAIFAGEVIGALITGGIFRTATGGRRIEITETDAQRIAFYSGVISEWFPGGVTVDAAQLPGYDQGSLEIAAPDTSAVGGGGGAVGRLTLRSQSSDVIVSQPSSVELDADVIYLNGQPYARQRSWSFAASPFANLALTVGAFGTILSGTVVGAPPGDYLVAVTAQLSADTNRVNTMRLNGPAGLQSLVDPRCDLTTLVQPQTYTTTIDNHPGGNIALTFQANLAAGSGTRWAQGSRLNLIYLGPRS